MGFQLSLRASNASVAINRVECSETVDCFANARNDKMGFFKKIPMSLRTNAMSEAINRVWLPCIVDCCARVARSQ